VPLWQVAQAPVTATPWLCFQVEGRHVAACAEWQVTQLAEVAMWFADLPTPLLPPGPWQDRQSVAEVKLA